MEALKNFGGVWLSCAELCGEVAETNGRSGARWRLLGLLLPVVGIMLVMLLPMKTHRLRHGS